MESPQYYIKKRDEATYPELRRYWDRMFKMSIVAKQQCAECHDFFPEPTMIKFEDDYFCYTCWNTVPE